MFYVADTHAWVYYLLDRLPKDAEDAFSSAERGESIVFVPTISLAECVYLVENRKISLKYEELFSRLRAAANFSAASLTLELVEKLPSIRLHDIHDRIIVVTAQLLNASVLTKDPDIVNSGLVSTVW